MKDFQQHKGKKQPEKSHSLRYSKDLEGMVLDIHDEEGMLPLFVKFPSVGVRKIIKTRNGVQMV